MKELVKRLDSRIILIVLISFVSAFIFLPYLFGSTAFILGWDMRQLYSSNFEALRSMLQNSLATHRLPFWSWVSFLGNDFYSSKLFYFQDLFDYPFAFTDLPYTTVILISTYLKFLVAGLTFYTYCAYHKYSNRTKILGSLIFAFSAYNLQTMMHPFFGSFFVFLPLYFLGIDQYICEHRKRLFIFMVFFLFVNNYYLFYSVSLFTILYFLIRYHQNHHTYKGFLFEALHLIGWYMIGFLLSGVVVIPEVMTILSNSRVGKRSSVLLFQSIQPYLEYLFGLFTPTSALANRETAISSVYSYTSANDSVMAVFIWASSITTILAPQLFSKKNTRRIHNLLYLLINSLVALVPIFSSIMHGFSEPSFRWLASPSFLLITAILPYLNNSTLIDRALLKKSIICFPILLIISTPLSAILCGKNLSTILSEYWLILLFVPTLVLIGYGFWKNKNRLVFLSLIIELCIVSFFSFYGCPPFAQYSKESITRSSHILGSKNEYNQYLLNLDSANETEFFRNYIEKDTVYWQESINYNLDFNIMGLLSYDSTYHFSANDLKLLGNVESYLPWAFDIEDPEIMNLVSVKYALVTAEDQVPFSNYKLVGDFYGMLVYENEDYINLGKTYSEAISYEDYSSSNKSLVTTTVIAHKEDLDEIQELLGSEIASISTAIKGPNSLYADITCIENGFAVLSVPYDPGWTVTVNGTRVKTFEVNGGLTGLAIPSGYSEIQMFYYPSTLKYGLICSGLGLLLLLASRLQKKI